MMTNYFAKPKYCRPRKPFEHLAPDHIFVDSDAIALEIFSGLPDIFANDDSAKNQKPLILTVVLE